MQAAEIITDVRQELLETTGSFWSDAELIRLINRGQRDYVRRTKVVDDRANLSLEIGRNDYPLPGNWMRAQAVFHKETSASSSVSWRQLSPSQLHKMALEVPNFLDTTTVSRRSRPSRFWIWGRVLYIDPPPAQVEDSDLVLFYNSKPRTITLPTHDLDIPDELSEAINAYVLWKAWSKETELDLADGQALIYMNYIGEGLRYAKHKAANFQGALDIQSALPFTYGVSSGFNPLDQ